ncbi:hypothetical protein DL96DRAFT_497738 [Flagelloscypha sp. PMI_526]|nr:hypothetical protein DL96DRAFT_497738 [Flagelloscypha sp. PMI_526]
MPPALSLDLFPQFLAFLSFNDLKACSLVNSVLCNISQPLLFSSITFGELNFLLSGPRHTPYFFLNSPRGRVLGRQARMLTVVEQPFDVQQTSQFVEFLQDLQNVTSLSIVTVLPLLELDKSVQEAIILHLLPSIRQLHISPASGSFSFNNFIAKCSSLQYLGLKHMHVLTDPDENLSGTIATFEHLSFDPDYFGAHSGKSFVENWIIRRKENLRRISFNRGSAGIIDLAASCLFLQRLTSLEQVDWGISFYISTSELCPVRSSEVVLADKTAVSQIGRRSESEHDIPKSSPPPLVDFLVTIPGRPCVA